MRIVVFILALLVGLAGARAGEERQKPLGDVPLMHEEAEAAGLHSVYDGPWEFFVGGGGAAVIGAVAARHPGRIGEGGELFQM